MNIQEFRLLKSYIAPYKVKLATISLLAVVCAFFEAVNLGSLVPLIQMMGGSTEPGGTLWSFLESVFAFFGLELNFFNLLAVMAILFIIGQVLLYQKKKMQANLWFRLSADLKEKIFSKILSADIQYHYSQKTGQFNDILTRESEYAATSVFAVTEIFTFIIFILFYTAMLLYISVELTVICLIVAGCTLYFLNTMIAYSKTLGTRAVETSMRLNEFISERLNLVKLIKTFSTENLENQRFRNITLQYADDNTSYLINGIKIETVFQVIIFTIAIVILYISTFVFQLPLAIVLVFIFILVRLTDPLRQLNAQRHQLAGELASLEKIDGVLLASSTASTIQDGKSDFSGFSGSIQFKEVNFSYTPSSPTLNNVSFTIGKNEMVALVGASGGGKSTIVDLLIRLIEPDQGAVLIDGTDIRNYHIGSYHNKIGFVSQESYLFNDTAINNICYGASDCDPGRAVAAAKIANAHEFITGLPKGYDTELGERGMKLSGGQKQRIALARALYKDPSVLILDEATSSLDSESEKVIQQSIADIKHKYTIIVIAHRLSTVENADSILVIEKGEVVEKGVHSDLLKSGGTYAKYYQLQHSREEEPAGISPGSGLHQHHRSSL